MSLFSSPPPIVARRSRTETLLTLPQQIALGVRLYQRTPARLRRPEPALRLGVASLSIWFTRLFAVLGVYAGRAVVTSQPDHRVLWSFGFYAAAALGPIGLGLFLTRRYRVGLGFIAAMLLMGQAVAIATIF
jgi:hypothetical protein